MTRLRIASLFVAVVAGDYAVLRLIYGQLADFGVSAAVCAGSLVTAGLIAYADNRRRQAVARGRAAVWQRRDKQATTGATTSTRHAAVRPNNQANLPDSLTGRAASYARRVRRPST
jgi:hypothetical protein